MIAVLWLFFILLSGKINWEIVLTGAFLALAVFGFSCAFLSWSGKREMRFYKRVPKLALYALYLLLEIFRANLSVLKLVYSKKKPKPDIVTFRTRAASDWGRSLLANSVTLTPGTITILSEKDKLTVHCLDESMKDGLEDSAFEKRICKMEAEK